ncbi:MAG: HutD family protein [Proteobacteria bacterium]|nr:HutD family protein [Pseudomonadota bacterium]
MRIIRASDCKMTPWKNGGGSTTEIAVAPADASLDDFDWRISMAVVASDGPFSNFPGIDRTLAVVKGNGLILTIGNRAPVTLADGTAPISFAGDTPTSARLTAGEITDLNIMTRHGCFRHHLVRVSTSMSCDFGDNQIAVVLSLNGTTEIIAGENTATLEHGDAALIDRATTTDFRIVPATSNCHLIWLTAQ